MVARLLRWPILGLALATVMFFPVLSGESPVMDRSDRVRLILVGLAVIGLTATELWELRLPRRWKRSLALLEPVVLESMGWEEFEGIAVPYAPGALCFVVPTARGIIELLCSFKNEVVICIVKAPPGHVLDERTWKRWDSLEREFLLEAIEHKLSTQVRWHHVGQHQGAKLPLAVRAPTLVEGIEYVAELVATHYPDVRRPARPGGEAIG